MPTKRKARKKKKRKGPDTITVRDRRYREKSKRDGLVQIHIFVPVEHADELRTRAAELRDLHAKKE